ncbi:hypothetical protein S245_065958, partial [Arachis hypogaea]
EGLVAATLLKVNATMDALNRNIVRLLEFLQKEHSQLDVFTDDLRKALGQVDECLNKYVRMGGEHRIRTVGAGSQVTAAMPESSAQRRGERSTAEDVDIVDLTAGPHEGRTATLGTLGGANISSSMTGHWAESTIMFESMLHDDHWMALGVSHQTNLAWSAHAPQYNTPHSTPNALGHAAPDTMGSNVRSGANIIGSVSGLQAKFFKRGELLDDMRTPRKMPKNPRQQNSQHIPSSGAVIFPPFIHAGFKITRQMGFPLEAAQMMAYIFGECLNLDEKLFCRDDRQLDREAFSSLLPGNESSAYILELLALRTSWTQSQLQWCSVWSLPLIFLEFALTKDIDNDQLMDYFRGTWLPRPNALRYIYVQMKDVLEGMKECHYYLMVVDVSGRRMWIFDRFSTQETVMGRSKAVKSV